MRELQEGQQYSRIGSDLIRMRWIKPSPQYGFAVITPMLIQARVFVYL